jgi:cysteine synthase A
MDRIVTVEDHEAIAMTGRLAREEGLLVGISSGSNVVAAGRIAAELGPGSTVVTVLCDTGERYLSVEL